MHKAKAAEELLQNITVNVQQWPRQSPDLNPRENLWPDLKTAVHLTELEQFYEEEWENITAKLKETYPRRLQLLPKVHLLSTDLEGVNTCANVYFVF